MQYMLMLNETAAEFARRTPQKPKPTGGAGTPSSGQLRRPE